MTRRSRFSPVWLIPNIGDWTAYQPVSVLGVHITSGFHILRFVEDTNGAVNFGQVSALDVVLPPPPLQGISVVTNSTSVLFQIQPALATNYSVGGTYIGGGVTNNFGTGAGPSGFLISSLRPNTTYTISFHVRDLVELLSGSTTTTNITTLPVPTLQGLSVAATNATSIVFQIPQALATNYTIAGYYVAAGVTNTIAGTGPGPSIWGVGPLQSNTAYAFFFFENDLVNYMSGSPVTINATTLLPVEYNQISGRLNGYNFR